MKKLTAVGAGLLVALMSSQAGAQEPVPNSPPPTQPPPQPAQPATTDEVTPPSLKKQEEAKYPKEALDAKVEGTVGLELFGHLHNVIHDNDAFFQLQLQRMSIYLVAGD